MLEKILYKLGYVKKTSKWQELLSIKAPLVSSREFLASCNEVFNQSAFRKGIEWLITESLKKVTNEEEMMNKETFQLLMAGILATDNVYKQFEAWKNSYLSQEDEEEFDEHAVI